MWKSKNCLPEAGGEEEEGNKELPINEHQVSAIQYH